MNIKNTIIEHYKKFFDLHAKGIVLTEDDHLNIDWAENLVKDCFNPIIKPRFKVNGLCRRKEGWRYAGSIKRAKDIQKVAIAYGISSFIYEWIDGDWVKVG